MASKRFAFSKSASAADEKESSSRRFTSVRLSIGIYLYSYNSYTRISYARDHRLVRSE